jgi:NitT/TauT family transport system substrate-binding protein
MRVSRAASKHLIAATVASLLIFSGITAFAQQTRLNVGYVGINSDNVIAFIAKETGIFAKNGLDVQLIYFGGGSIATMSLISGETPITQTAGPGIVNAVLNGSDAVMIAGGVTTLDYWMLSRPEIKTAEQLKGGAVAISRFGSASDFIVRYALQRLGLIPVKEVAILQVGPLPDRLAAMETKRVEATVLAPPAMYMAQKRGYNIIADIAALGLAYQATGVGTTRKFIREHPDVVRRYVKAQVEAVHRFKTDRESSIRVLSKYLSLKDKDILDKTYDGAIAENKLPGKQYPTLEGIKTILEPLKNDPKAKSAKPEDFVDMRFIKELDDSGYITSLYKESRRRSDSKLRIR